VKETLEEKVSKTFSY